MIHICIERGVTVRYTGSLSHQYFRLHFRQFQRLPKDCPLFKYKRHDHWLNVVLLSYMDIEVLQCCCIIYICIERGVTI